MVDLIPPGPPHTQVLERELPSDPLTQALLALYFFLAGMIVRAHAFMWLMPATFSMCAAASIGLHRCGHALTPAYA